MTLVKYCFAPSGRYVAWFEENNGCFYGSGITPEKALKNAKQNYWKAKRSCPAGCRLDIKESDKELAPLKIMTHKFKVSAWCKSKKDTRTSAPSLVIPVEKVTIKEEEKFDEYSYEEKNGVLVVYGIKKIKVAEYNMAPEK